MSVEAAKIIAGAISDLGFYACLAVVFWVIIR
jgi:hypothetical protein